MTVRQIPKWPLLDLLALLDKFVFHREHGLASTVRHLWVIYPKKVAFSLDMKLKGVVLPSVIFVILKRLNLMNIHFRA